MTAVTIQYKMNFCIMALYGEDGGSMALWNVGFLLHHYYRRPWHESSLCKSQVLQNEVIYFTYLLIKFFGNPHHFYIL